MAANSAERMDATMTHCISVYSECVCVSVCKCVLEKQKNRLKLQSIYKWTDTFDKTISTIYFVWNANSTHISTVIIMLMSLDKRKTTAKHTAYSNDLLLCCTANYLQIIICVRIYICISDCYEYKSHILNFLNHNSSR